MRTREKRGEQKEERSVIIERAGLVANSRGTERVNGAKEDAE